MKKILVVISVIILSIITFLCIPREKKLQNEENIIEESKIKKASNANVVSVFSKYSYEIPVLAYHHFMPDDEKALYEPDGKYTMSLSQFEEQLKYLSDNGYKTLNSEEFKAWYEGKIEISDKCFLITIDDGNISSYYHALPLLEKYNFNSIIFLIGDRVGTGSEHWDPERTAFVGKDIIKDIKENHKSMEIGSHSHTMHSLINGINPKDIYNKEEMIRDLVKSKENITINYFAYPYGNYDEKYKESLEESGFDFAFTFGTPKKASRNEHKYELSRININAHTSMDTFIKYFE